MSSEIELPDFCVPRPGSTTLRTVLSAALRRAVGDLQAVLRAHARGPAGRDVVAFSRVVGPLARADPGAVMAAVRRTEVGVWLRCLRPGARAEVDPAQGVPALLATLALELSLGGALPGPLRLHAWPARVLSSAGRVELPVPAGAGALVFEAGRVTVERGGAGRAVELGPSDAAYRVLPGSEVRLALCDDNPLASLEAHPDKQGNALDLGGHEASRWCETLGEALTLIGRYLPEMRAEIELVLQQVVPVGYDAERHVSASIQEAIGTVYLSLHPNVMTMVEAVIHEVSHNKLAALFELDPVLDESAAPVHASPVRPDPRPLRGVLLAVHAFLPVAALYAAMIEARAPGHDHPDFARRHAQVVQGNREGAAVLLEHARPTALGRAVLEEIERLG